MSDAMLAANRTLTNSIVLGDGNGCVAGPIQRWRVYAQFNPDNASLSFVTRLASWKSKLVAFAGCCLVYVPVIVSIYSLLSLPYSGLGLDLILGQSQLGDAIARSKLFAVEDDDFTQALKMYVQAFNEKLTARRKANDPCQAS